MKMALSEMKIRKAKPREKAYKLSDGGGMYLFVTPAGGKLWRANYTFGGKSKTLSMGQYPIMTLAQAREALLAAKKMLAEGVNPSRARKERQDRGKTFEVAALEWWREQQPNWSEKHADRLLRRMQMDLFPFIGDQPMGDLRASDVEDVLKRAALRSLDTAHRLKSALRGVFNYGIRKGCCENNPIPAMKGVLPTNKHVHHAAPTDPVEVGKLLCSIDRFDGSFVVGCALRLAPLLFCRPGELRQMEWTELDIERGVWSIPGEKMKMNNDHLVPLSTQAVAVLIMIKPLTGHGRYVFSSRVAADKPMSDATVNKALRKLGYSSSEITGHGFRAMARTMIHERLHFTPDAIEAQLAHVVPDRLGSAYNRAIHWDERVKMMQVWADYLEQIKTVSS